MSVAAQSEFLARVYTLPLLRSDAIVVLSGDGTKRNDVALQLFRPPQQGGQFIVVTGGLDNPPFSLPAPALASNLIGHGVAPDRIIQIAKGKHTRAEADAVVKLAKQRKWRRLLVVTSAFHAPRTMLTFIQALHDAKAETKTQVLVVPASQLRWNEQPDGAPAPRTELFRGELQKIEEYAAKGDVATYDRGLEYLNHWEGK